jgi:D-alanyl-D-alanine carboxypeptidase
MTRKAQALASSHRSECLGLPNDDQVTTARDQPMLGRAIQERFPRYYTYFSTRVFNFRGQSIGNHNRLLGRVEGVDGIKTGYIGASGFNLVTSVHRGNRYLVAAVFGGSSAGSRDARMRDLISANIAMASLQRTAPMVAEVQPKFELRAPEPKVAEQRLPSLGSEAKPAAPKAVQGFVLASGPPRRCAGTDSDRDHPGAAPVHRLD